MRPKSRRAVGAAAGGERCGMECIDFAGRFARRQMWVPLSCGTRAMPARRLIQNSG